MSRFITLTFLAAFLPLSHSLAQDDASELNPEVLAIDICRWFSIFARDMMIDRQENRPMSEVLPSALDRLEVFPEGVEGPTGEFLESLEYLVGKEPDGLLYEFQSSLKPMITELVKEAYDVPVYSTPGNQRTAISDFENDSFEACFEGFEDLELAE